MSLISWILGRRGEEKGQGETHTLCKKKQGQAGEGREIKAEREGEAEKRRQRLELSGEFLEC